MQNTEKSLIALKKAQTDLNTELKNGKITQDQYIASKVQLDGQLKKENDTRKTLTQTLNAENNSINAQKILLADLVKQRNQVDQSTQKGIDTVTKLNEKILQLNTSLKAAENAGGNFGRNVGNYGDKFKEFAGGIQVAGLNLGALTTGMTGLINPVTGAAAAITALGAAYANSAVGAMDLRNATDNFKATFDVLSNDVGNASGGGFLSKLSNAFGDAILYIKNLGDTSEIKIKNEAAVALAVLRDLEVEQIKVDKDNADRADAAYKNKVIRDDAVNQTFTAREAAAAAISKDLQDRTIKQNELDEKKIKALQEYGILTNQINATSLKAYDQEGELNKQILTLETAISLTKAENGRKIDQALLAEIKITNEKSKQLKIEQDLVERLKLGGTTGGIGTDSSGKAVAVKGIHSDTPTEGETDEISQMQQGSAQSHILDDEAQAQRDHNKVLKEIFGERAEIYVGDTTNVKKEASVQEALEKEKIRTLKAGDQLLKSSTDLAGQLLGQKSDAYKAFAVATTLASTYLSAQQAYESAFLPVPFYGSPILGAISAAAAVVEGLANVAQIENIHFSKGGYTGDGSKYQPAGVVHAGEVVWSQEDNARAGGAAFVNSMRPTYRGYADGGLVTNTMTNPINQQNMIAESMKHMPPTNISWKEGLITDARIKFKENLTTR